MDIKQLTYFMAVAQEGSYSKAAEKLGISQPTLSIAVKKLEEELGLPLFYTFNRRQVLTDGGLRLMNGGRQLIDLYQKTVEDVKVTDSYKYFSLFYLAGGSLCSTKSPPKSVQSLVSFFVFCSIHELVTGGPLCVFCCVFFEADGWPMNVKISDIAAPHKRPG